MPEKWIYWLDELGQELNDVVGKKCANLGELTRMGLRVPPGFALSVDAYQEFLHLSGASEEIIAHLNRAGRRLESVDDLYQTSAGLRKIVDSKPLPRTMADTVLSYYRELCRKCNTEEIPVSTRSAGTASHPGQYETHLNVKGESDLIEKIKKVSTMIIEANWGLGESVVGGETMPDVFFLEKESLEIIDKKLGTKRRAITMRKKGVVEEETLAEKRASFCLSDEEAKEIGRLGKILEAHFGSPQDTEWAIDTGLAFPESVILLQTRPEVIAQQKTPVDQVIDMMISRL
jgi:pyruvate,water dikinase